MMRPRQPRVQLSRNRQIIKAGMVPIPFNLRPAQLQQYPPDNSIAFERWYMEDYKESDQVDRLYLPIQWTALYCNNNYGKCQKTLLQIQAVLDGLDKSKKYYTIIQYDDGILNTLKHLDIKVFAMSGPRVDFPIPLLSTPHQYNFGEIKKDIFASFVGRITHPVRTEMILHLDGKDGYYISTKPHSLREYCEILARSKYALCPRGYGQTSFRVQEAIQYGAIPVYISTGSVLDRKDFLVPYDELIFPICHEDDLFALHKQLSILYDYEAGVERMRSNAHLFTYEGCKNRILKELKREENA